MSLPSGTRLGSYEVKVLLGAGGMGEVYHARDNRLNRDVAIKVLPEIFAGDPDRLARFEREAQVLAALNHPNIAQIYGLEDNALVMELVEGQDLSSHLQRGALPIPEALAIARQLADALEAAHEHGIIHRDLKPQNIKIRPDGTVKVLDFGLAKAMDPGASGAQDTHNSPTLTARATQMGMIIGTAAYMAPEQARGRAVDRRADIWAFGVVLYEMLTGRRAFDGDDISITLAAVLKEDVDWQALPAGLPASLRRLLRRCLEKDPKQRLSAIGDARLELNERDEPPVLPAVEASLRQATKGRAWLMAAAGVLAGAAIASAAFSLWRAPENPPEVKRLTIIAPDNAQLYADSRQSSISPDGRKVAFVTGIPARIDATQLWVRDLADPRPRLIEGATGAHLPFWSPDSSRIAFFAKGKLMVVPAAGGRVDTIADAPAGRGGSWSVSDVIVYSPDSAGPLMRVAADGGTPAATTTLDTAAKESGHRFPYFLPDGRHFLFATLPAVNGSFSVVVGSIDSMDRTPLLTSEAAAVYADPGYVIFVRRGALVAQAFDAASLTLRGSVVTLDEVPGAVGNQFSSAPGASVSGRTLVYLNDPFADTKLAWFSLDGRQQETLPAQEARVTELRLSPDNSHVAVVRSLSAQRASLWAIDLARAGAAKVADAPGLNYQVVWSADGKRLAWTNDGGGTETIMTRDAEGISPESRMFASPSLFKKPMSWSSSGTLLFTQRSPDTDNDLIALSADGRGEPYLQDRFSEDAGRFSPDGRWVAYVSDETGSGEVYVRSFPAPTRKYRITTDGGTWVTWDSTGSQLLMVGADGRQLKVAQVRVTGSDLAVSVPVAAGSLPAAALAWDASRDLRRMLVSLPEDGSASLSLTVVTDWLSALAKR